MRDKTLSQKVLTLSDGVLQYLTDFTLYLTFSCFASLGKRPTPYDIWQISEEAMQMLEKVNYQKLKQNLRYLARKGFLNIQKSEDRRFIEITKEGEKRLRQLLPSYQEKRTWDGKIYTITYDIPEKKRGERNLLRRYLKILGAAKLQKSVYLTPYNPTGILKKFIQENALHGTIIVSCIGKDGFIGEEDIKTLIRRLYKIDKLNQKYEDFLQEVKKATAKDKLKLQFHYLSILKEDPQLPFQFLPQNFKGKEAYQAYLKICKS